MSTDSLSLKRGRKLRGGRYTIKKVLGHGGFGITYLASDKTTGADVAIKEFFPRDYCGRGSDGSLSTMAGHNTELVDTLRRRFFKEANNLSRLDHPNIVKVQEVFEELSTAYIVMEFISGEDLNTLTRRQPGGKLDENTAVAYIRSIGGALAYMHSRRMTHLDIKPANIMVRASDNTPILIDFGFSKEYTPTGTNRPSMTPPAITPGYSPLELYGNGSLGDFSPQSDIYSLGATLHFLVFGQAPPSAPELTQRPYNMPATASLPIPKAIQMAMRLRRSDRTDKVDEVLALLPAVQAPATKIIAEIDDDDVPPMPPFVQELYNAVNELQARLNAGSAELAQCRRELENWKKRATKAEATVDWQNRVIAQNKEEDDSWSTHLKAGVIGMALGALLFIIINLLAR